MRTAEQRAEEEAGRRHHAANPVRQRPPGAIHQRSFAAILNLPARFKAVRESQGLTLAEVAERMGIDPKVKHEAQRVKLAHARHRGRERNLELPPDTVELIH